MQTLHEEIQTLRDLLNTMGTTVDHFHEPLFIFYSQQLDEKINRFYSFSLNPPFASEIEPLIGQAI
jgi:hypothetical protein